MIILNNDTTSLEIILGGATSDAELQWTVSWRGVATSYPSGNGIIDDAGYCNQGETNGATGVEMVSSPDSNTQTVHYCRHIEHLSVYNSDSATADVTIRYNVNGTYTTILKISLGIGFSIYYTGTNWQVLDASGRIVTTVVSSVAVPDGTYGDIVVSSSGTVWTLLASINKAITGEWSFRYDKFFLYNAAATFYHKFRSLATATRTVTFPDFDGTVCLQNTMFITGGDQTTTANTAQNITELVTESLPANTRWRFRGFISPGCNNTGGVKFAVVIPTAATVQLGLIGRDSSATTTINAAISASATLSPAFNSVNAANGRLWIEGEVAIGANAGTVQFQFAAGTSGQTATIYQLGTGITYMRIA